MKSQGEPKVVVLDPEHERAIRKRHLNHPYDDACWVLAQLDMERAAHQLDILALKAQIKSLEEELGRSK